MSSNVIQGCFPNGMPRFAAPPVAQAKPANSRIVPLPAHVVQRSAVQLPPHLATLPAGAGQPLQAAVRQKMEAAFGTSFADVRVHVGPQAPAIGAVAFTQGSNVYFAPGQYAPQTARGQQLLAHELAHVVQQRSGRVRNPFGNGVAVVHDHLLEAEATRMRVRATTVQRSALSDLVEIRLEKSIRNLATKTVSGGIELSGDYSTGEKVTGSVYTPSYYLDPTGHAATAPIPEASASLLQKAYYTKAMRVHNITVSPTGAKLGDLLAWAVACRAEEQSINVVVAMKVNPKARNFYIRLGFTEYDAERGYPFLVSEKAKLEQKMRTATPEELEALSPEYDKITSGIAESTLIVATKTLKTKAAENWNAHWKKKAEGHWEEK